MTDQEKFTLNLIESLKKRGLSSAQAIEAIKNTKLTDDELKIVLQESKSFKDEIKEVELNTIPALAQEGYDIELSITTETRILSQIESGNWFDAWVEKMFPAIKKATNEFNKMISDEVERITSKTRIDEIIKAKGDKFDFEELKLENDLALYRFKRTNAPLIDAKHKVTDNMREDFINAAEQQRNIKTKPIEDRIDELNSRVSIIKQTIAKTLFISLEEAHLVIIANNFFSTIFSTLTSVERAQGDLAYTLEHGPEVDKLYIKNKLEENIPFEVLKLTISQAYEAKQISMKAKIEKLKAEKVSE